MRIRWREIVGFLLGAALVLLMALTLGLIPTHIDYCSYNQQTRYEECATYHVALVAFWQIGKALNWISPALTALATIAIAAFTFTLWWSTRGMLRTTNAALKLGRDEFNATHRPRVRVKNVWITQPFVADGPIIVDVLIVNVGNAPALIATFGIDFRVIDPSIGMLPGDLEPPNLASDLIGKICTLGFTFRIGGIRSAPFDEAQVDAIKDEKHILACFGKVEYWDTGPIETRRIRRTSFYRVFKPFPPAGDGMGRFIIPEKSDPDYEYED